MTERRGRGFLSSVHSVRHNSSFGLFTALLSFLIHINISAAPREREREISRRCFPAGMLNCAEERALVGRLWFRGGSECSGSSGCFQVFETLPLMDPDCQYSDSSLSPHLTSITLSQERGTAEFQSTTLNIQLAERVLQFCRETRAIGWVRMVQTVDFKLHTFTSILAISAAYIRV